MSANLDPKEMSHRLVMGKAAKHPGYTSKPPKTQELMAPGTFGSRGNVGAKPRGLVETVYKVVRALIPFSALGDFTSHPGRV